MQLIPAVDLMQGQVVRLRQGQLGTETIYGGDPLEVAQRLIEQGATLLHVVDLDSALGTNTDNRATIWRIVDAVTAGVQVGGGFRTPAEIDQAYARGVSAVVVSTSIFSDSGHTMLSRYCQQLQQGRLIPSVDVKDGLVALSGWKSTTTLRPETAIKTLATHGVRRVIYTETSRDGVSAGPSRPTSLRVPGMEMVVAGGIRDLNDLLVLARDGFEGAIVGRAIYDGTLDVKQALAALAPVSRPQRADEGEASL